MFEWTSEREREFREAVVELWEATRREQAADALMLRAQLAAIKPASNWRPADRHRPRPCQCTATHWRRSPSVACVFGKGECILISRRLVTGFPLRGIYHHQSFLLG